MFLHVREHGQFNRRMDCPSGVGLPLCPGRYLPDGVHVCSDPEVLTPTYQIPTLTIGGSLDDVVRVSRIAETWYTQQGSSVHQVALVEGMNHGDVMDIIHDAVNQMDLPSEIGSEAARAAVADLIVGFAAGPVAFQTEALDATFSPFVDVFVKQERRLVVSASVLHPAWQRIASSAS